MLRLFMPLGKPLYRINECTYDTEEQVIKIWSYCSKVACHLNLDRVMLSLVFCGNLRRDM